MVNSKFSFLLFLAASLAFASCKKDDPNPDSDLTPVPAVLKGLLVSCEGQFQQGNATAVLLNGGNFQPQYNIFENTNEIPMGDVLQSISKVQDGYLFCLNGSGTIVKTDFNLKKKGEIGALSPRFVHQISSTKAYVSDFFSNEIAILNPSTMATTGSVDTGAWTEKMIRVGDKVWAVDKSNDRILIINPDTDEIENQILLTAGASDLVLDAQGKVWVLCQGPFSGPGNAVLYRINPVTNGFMNMFDFNPGQVLGQLRINAAGDQLFFTKGQAVLKMDITALIAPSTPFITLDFNPYGLDIDPDNGEIFVCDPADFVDLGSVHRFDAEGVFLDVYTVGVAPNAVYFFSK